MIALGFWASWAVIGLAVVGLILFYKVLDLSADALAAWRADLPANKERER